MKTLSLILFLSFMLTEARSQALLQKISGFHLGCSKSETQTAIVSRGGVQAADLQEYKKLKYGDYTAEVKVNYVNGVSTDVTLTITPPFGKVTLKDFHGIRAQLDADYGPGKMFKEFRIPYVDGDGYEVDAVMVDKGTYSCSWSPGNTGAPAFVLMWIAADGGIRVRYSQEPLPKRPGT